MPALRFAGREALCVLLALPVVTYSAWPFHRAALRNLRHGASSMDTLVSLGVLASFGWALWSLVAGSSGPGYWLGFGVTAEGADAVYLDVAAGVTTFLLAGRYGWDTRVGEGGSKLSGGERQRVSIARALLKNAPIVLLDEATSALDIGNEIAIGAAIDAIRPDRTLIVVAHRLQTILTADQIIMLDDDGGIREIGTHSELLAADGAYAHYWRERVDAAGWQLTH